MKLQKRSFVALSLAVVACGCALPPRQEEIPGVSSRELRAVTLIRQGNGYLNVSRFVDAELSFREALYYAPAAKNLRLSLSVALTGAGQFAEAEAILNELVALQPDSADLMGRKGAVALARGEELQALQLFKKSFDLALRAGDQSYAVAAARTVAQLAEKIGLEEDALCYTQLLQWLRRDNDATFEVADLLIKRGYYARALEELAPLRDAKEILSAAFYYSALASLGLRNYTQALDYATTALRISKLDFETARNAEFVQIAALHKAERTAAQSALLTELSAKYRDDDSRSGMNISSYPSAFGEAYEEIFERGQSE